MTPYAQYSDEFGIVVNLNTKLPLPTRRESVLGFFDSFRRAYPQLTDFDCKDNGDFSLEEDREKSSHRSITLESKRASAGFVNPPDFESADQFLEHFLEITPYHLDFNQMDCEALDVVFAFDFSYAGNHDEVVAEALGISTPLDPLIQIPGAKVLNYEPSLMMALDETCRLQCRFHIETRTNAFQVRTNQFPDANITAYFTVRQYWNRQGNRSLIEAYRQQKEICNQITLANIIPNIIKPLAQAISARQ